MGVLWFIVGGMVGMIATSLIVAADWDNHPKQERSRWLHLGKDSRYECLNCGRNTLRPESFCPECGAKMGGVIENKG